MVIDRLQSIGHRQLGKEKRDLEAASVAMEGFQAVLPTLPCTAGVGGSQGGIRSLNVGCAGVAGRPQLRLRLRKPC